MPPRREGHVYLCECGNTREPRQEGCDTCHTIDRERFSWATARNSPSMREKELVVC